MFPEIKRGKTEVEPTIGIAKLFEVEAEGASDYAKLLFWCFVAGFSERFVTDIIGRFADQTTNALQAGGTDTPAGH
ncbi:MAG: hypothetical protein JSS01_10620 [Proteobacteria bacterium]|nr:hypothetical protein [Pseudomonadota bacterium]